MSTVSASEAAKGIVAGVKVIDVRTARQHAADGVPGSLHLPLELIQSGAVPDGVARDETFYLVCEVGGFSELAAAYLRSAGFAQAFSVRGGLAALRPLLSEPPP